MTRALLATLAALTVLLATGCAGEEGPSATGTAPALGGGECPLLDVAEAARVLEVDLRETAVSPTGCVLAHDDSPLTVVLAASDVVDDLAGCPDATPVEAGEGVTAYVCEAGGAPQGFWLRGDDEVTLVITGTETTAKAFSSTVDLLPSLSAP